MLLSLVMAFQFLGATHYGRHRDVLQWSSLDSLPQCGENQLLISVQYAELNPVDLQKLWPGNEINKSGQVINQNESPLIVGYGGAGVVVQSKVDTFKEGDDVIFLADPRRSGAYATHVVVDAQCATKIPTNVPMSMAATLPLAGCTAFESLQKLSLTQAQRLLIVGGAGGVGSWATLLAKAMYPSMEVICTASSIQSQAWCQSNGASSTISHHKIVHLLGMGSFNQKEEGVDSILCLSEPTPDLWSKLTDAIRPFGTICLVVAGSSIRSLDLSFCFFKAVTITTETIFSTQRSNYSHGVPAVYMEKMLQLLASGVIVRAPLAEEALSWKKCLEEGGVLDRLASGHARGKFIMKID